jgi:hypothetical protein
VLAAASQMPGSTGDVSLATLIPSLVGAAAAAYVLLGAVRGWYWRTIGRRRDRYARLSRLGIGAQLPFFSSVLGEPPAMQRTLVKDDYLVPLVVGDPSFDPDDYQLKPETREFTISVFIDRDYYVQTVTDTDQTVLAYSVTSRSRRFRARYQPVNPRGLMWRWRWSVKNRRRYPKPLSVKLCRTRFADLDPDDLADFSPPHFKIQIGAHNFTYSEFRYFGNPGNYQSFVWTASDAALHSVPQGLGLARNQVGAEEWPDPEAISEPEWEQMPAVAKLRREAVITTYSVISIALPLRNYPLPRFGPNHNEVRTLK